MNHPPDGITIPGRLDRGFTLVELLVILILIGLILSLAVPRFSGFGEKEQLRAATRVLASQILEAQSQAITKARAWYLCLDLEKGDSWISTERADRDDEEGSRAGVVHLPQGLEFRDVIDQEESMVTREVFCFGFWPNGGNESGVVHLKNSLDEDMTLFIRPFLGLTEISQGYLREISN